MCRKATALLAATGFALAFPKLVVAQSEVQKVEVAGNASVEDRRDSNASKTVVTSEDLARFGDATGQVVVF
jgi:hypothetical protein